MTVAISSLPALSLCRSRVSVFLTDKAFRLPSKLLSQSPSGHQGLDEGSEEVDAINVALQVSDLTSDETVLGGHYG